METKEILAEVTGGNPDPIFQEGDAVSGRGDLIGTVVGFASGDIRVSWQDGEEWVYPASFLTLVNKGPFDTEVPSPDPMDLLVSESERLGLYADPPPALHDTSINPPELDWNQGYGDPAEVRQTDETTGAQKGTKPERFDLLPWDALEEVARVYAYGAQKYSDRNWEKGYPWSWSFQALIRHASRWMCGETYDKETGLHHMAHACFHALALVTYCIRGGVGKDDRPW